MPQVVVPAAPAAGHDFKWVAPPDTVAVVKLLTATLTTSATVANRTVVLEIVDIDGNVLGSLAESKGITATHTAVMTWGVGLDQTTAVMTLQVFSFPDIALPPGASVQSATTNLKAGDKWIDVFLVAELLPVATLTAG